MDITNESDISLSQALVALEDVQNQECLSRLTSYYVLPQSSATSEKNTYRNHLPVDEKARLLCEISKVQFDQRNKHTRGGYVKALATKYGVNRCNIPQDCRKEFQMVSPYFEIKKEEEKLHSQVLRKMPN